MTDADEDEGPFDHRDEPTAENDEDEPVSEAGRDDEDRAFDDGGPDGEEGRVAGEASDGSSDVATDEASDGSTDEANSPPSRVDETPLGRSDDRASRPYSTRKSGFRSDERGPGTPPSEPVAANLGSITYDDDDEGDDDDATDRGDETGPTDADGDSIDESGDEEAIGESGDGDDEGGSLSEESATSREDTPWTARFDERASTLGGSEHGPALEGHSGAPDDRTPADDDPTPADTLVPSPDESTVDELAVDEPATDKRAADEPTVGESTSERAHASETIAYDESAVDDRRSGDAPLADVVSSIERRRRLRAADPLDELFEQRDVGEIDSEALWESISADGLDLDGDERDVRVVEKHSYCEQCPHFAAPPAVACRHEGTEILELVDMRRFRVVDCPVVWENDRLDRGG